MAPSNTELLKDTRYFIRIDRYHKPPVRPRIDRRNRINRGRHGRCAGVEYRRHELFTSEPVQGPGRPTAGTCCLLKFTVNGSAKTGTGTTSSDATLSALALKDASDDSAITISPVFASGTTSYTASVVNGVDEITIAPTVNESNATVEYLDSSDTAITDADAMKDRSAGIAFRGREHDQGEGDGAGRHHEYLHRGGDARGQQRPRRWRTRSMTRRRRWARCSTLRFPPTRSPTRTPAPR